LQPSTHFQFPDDEGSFSRAALRCVGIGACRKSDSGTMCPSYRATLEEEHSTRGRARMLFELLQGEVVKGGWKDDHVKKSLELCLSCKACKSECPVNVDVATYKAEFLSHYYEDRWRPLQAYAFGWIDKWARLSSIFPAISNLFTHEPGFGTVLKKLLRIAEPRQFPKFAPQTFRQWARQHDVPVMDGFRQSRRDAPTVSRGRIILWTDTFTNYFRPEAGRAAVQVLEHAGFELSIPPRQFCCGRPLYDFGMLDDAKRYLRRILNVLETEIKVGTPVIVLEPSCASVFRDELHNLFPEDPVADQLRRQTFLLSEFLEQAPLGYDPPKLDRKALLHCHCHQQALMKTTHAESLLRKMGIELSVPDSGCCGMAGPFGFDKEKITIAQAIGERILLPAVRAASQETLIVMDGFSCREQVYQSTGRHAYHLAEVIQLALQTQQSPSPEPKILAPMPK
jgi:Fe-S oxidoreductase